MQIERAFGPKGTSRSCTGTAQIGWICEVGVGKDRRKICNKGVGKDICTIEGKYVIHRREDFIRKKEG